MVNYYFISDTHFGHKSIIEFCNRPFSSVDEMDEYMIESWNERVKQNDKIFILGDLFFKHSDPESILKQLKGKKYLILGNHDGKWYHNHEGQYNKYFESVHDYWQTNDGQHSFTLCHYPMMSWFRENKTYMIFGHIHNETRMGYWPVIANNERMLNACVEVNGYKPITFDELVENNRVFKRDNYETQNSQMV